ncbi:PREDICTED: auxin-responsive protein SAUR40-like [Tarenaya hassleriana]|uniref:auxin-responsive protein SAUR40-like n=1 Tax=Tarenaya hassleriana TaxID=28532 RepID=UPI00053CA6BC|nr:PREDICTED: auxin-responsive protein SAUR40-like [Tarenaya hassleriana]
MSPAMGKCNKIRRIVRIRQMLKQWRRKAHVESAGVTTDPTFSSAVAPSDVPPGHVAVCVGASRRRYVVRLTHLNHPIFRRLLMEAEEEYGFSQVGPLAIPCDESLFEEIVRVVTQSESAGRCELTTLEDLRRCSHFGMTKTIDYFGDSRPLLPGIADKSVC